MNIFKKNILRVTLLIGLTKSCSMHDKGHNFFNELKRRNVYRVATVYAIIGWLLIQIADATFSYLGIPDWMVTAVIIFVLIGFPVSLVLAWAFEMGPEGIIRTTSDKAEENPLPAHKKKPLTGTITIVILCILIAGQTIYFYVIRKPAPSAQPMTENVRSFPSNSIAVLPFVNLSNEQDNQYFSDGVMEAILNNLSMIQDLKVVSRTSVEKYRTQEKTIPEIGRELEVANILEGSVQRAGDRVRVTVQLISAEDDEHLWATSYDRNLTDIFSIQSEVAETIADNLEVILTTEELELIKNAPTSNMKAYELFLKVLFTENRSEAEINEKIGLLDEAIRLDPAFGMAYAAKAGLLMDLAAYGVSQSITHDSAMQVADHAIRLDDKVWMAYIFRASLYYRDRNYAEVVRNLQAAIEINPNSSWAYDWLGNYYQQKKEFDMAIEFRLKAASLSVGEASNQDLNERVGYFLNDIDLDQAYSYFLKEIKANPENADVLIELVACTMYRHEYDQMMEYARRFAQLRPDLVNAGTTVALCHLVRKEFIMAEQEYQQMLEKMAGYENEYMVYPFKHRLGYAKLMNGKVDEGKRMLESYRDTLKASLERKEIYAFGHGEYYDLALICSALGEKEQALEWLRKARDRETEGAFFRIDFLVADPMLDNLREEPDFIHLMEEKTGELEQIRSIFYQKLEEYHQRNELMWIQRLNIRRSERISDGNVEGKVPARNS